MVGMNDDAFDAMDQFKRVLVVANRLGRLAPAAIEDGVRRRHARRRGRLGVAHHGDEHIQRGPRMAARERTDFSDSFGHVGFFFERASGVDLTFATT